MPKYAITFLVLVFAAFSQSVCCVSVNGQSNEKRSNERERGITMSFSDSRGNINPLRGQNSSNQLAPLRSNTTSSSSRRSSSVSLASNMIVESGNTVRLASFQEPSEQEDLAERGPDEEDLDEPERHQSELLEAPESPLLPSLSDVRAPIVLNPFAGIRQVDSNGLLYEKDNYESRFAPATYSELTGRENRHLLAGYNAHRFHHNPLYFEEPNLERYGNELEFQRVASGARFFANAALLPSKLSHRPACSRVSTLGHKRPGEFVPYREYGLGAAFPSRATNRR